MNALRTLAVTVILAGSMAMAKPTTITLSVPGMTCNTCPITIKLALTKVPGVTKVSVSYKKLEAVVTFDDATTTVDALTKATADAGYPSTVKPLRRRP